MALHNIWKNDDFWFRISITAIAIWLIFSLTISLILYFSWIHHFEDFHSMFVEFSTWFFLLPAIAIFGICNLVPFVAPWIYATLQNEEEFPEEDLLAIEEVAKDSYQNLTGRLKAE